MLDVNLTGPFLCAQRVGLAMARRGSGAIVHIRPRRNGISLLSVNSRALRRAFSAPR